MSRNPFDSGSESSEVSLSDPFQTPDRTVNSNYKTKLCTRNKCDRKGCRFYHNAEERRLNYFGQNIPYEVGAHNEVMRWSSTQELRLRTLQRQINAGEQAFRDFQEVLREAKNKDVWLTLPPRDLV